MQEGGRPSKNPDSGRGRPWRMDARAGPWEGLGGRPRCNTGSGHQMAGLPASRRREVEKRPGEVCTPPAAATPAFGALGTTGIWGAFFLGRGFKAHPSLSMLLGTLNPSAQGTSPNSPNWDLAYSRLTIQERPDWAQKPNRARGAGP